MAVSIDCPECGELVGIEPEERTLLRASVGIGCDILSIGLKLCPGKGQHEEPIQLTTQFFFGWINGKRTYYTETHTETNYYQYVGPKNKMALWLAFNFLQHKGKYDLYVNHKKVYKNDLGKLAGPGLKELGLK